MKKKKKNNKMTNPQFTAFKNTCRLAEETINPIFGRMNKQGLSIILTLNSGYEWIEKNFGGPVWHVSIRNNGKLDSLRHLAKKELQGVGDASKGEWEELSPTAYHLRRRLSDKEDQKIGPAIDIRGSVEEIERLKRVRSFLFSS